MLKPNNEEPLVTVFIPSYNHEKFIKEAIISVINQNYQNIEMLIIEDGSTDGSIGIVESMLEDCKSRFVRFDFITRKNEGLASGINYALNWSSGKYLSFQASDDVIFQDKIRKTVDILESCHEAAVVCGSSIEIDERGNRIGQMVTVNKNYELDDIVLHDYVLSAPTMLIRRDVLRQIGPIPPHILIEDWYMWIKITQLGWKIKTVPDVFAFYRRHGSNFSSKYEILLKARLDVIQYATEHRHYSRSVARIFLMSSIDYSAENKLRAVEYIYRAMCIYPKSLFLPQFRYGIVRIIVPSILLKWLKRHRAGNYPAPF